MKAKTTDGQEFDLKQDLLDGLKMRLRGPLLLPGEPGYDDSRTVWNGMIDRRPAAVARCLGTADVIECVKLARAPTTCCSASRAADTISPGWLAPTAA